MFKRRLLALFTAATFAMSPASGQAQGNFSLSDVAEVSVLPGWRTENGTHIAAIRIALAPGWKTYWRSPGEFGIPPRFSWRGSRNLASVQIHWPTPNISYTNGLRAIGYSGVIIVPLELTPRKSDQSTIALRGELEIGVCRDICVPMVAKIQADLPQSGSSDAVIQASLADRPASQLGENLERSKQCSVAKCLHVVPIISLFLSVGHRCDLGAHDGIGGPWTCIRASS